MDPYWVGTQQGSSPLTRGKHDGGARVFRQERLIPAHAGKTLEGDPVGWIGKAHPRSRGENFLIVEVTEKMDGSSPLTRGKPHARGRPGNQRRLIPAHAGKTRAAAIKSARSWAHPRSRGENAWRLSTSQGLGGSSPLTRGKPVACYPEVMESRLIPAHAGKT